MSRKRDKTTEAPGQDSFLDVVANLVGILIILIILIGARARDVAVQAATDEATADQQQAAADGGPGAASREEISSTAESARRDANAIEQDVNEIHAQIQRGNVDVEYRRHERDKFNLLVTMAEQELEKHRGKLSASQQQQYDVERELIAARTELDELSKGRDFYARSEPETTVLEHLPTPMARTVFGKEVHFRLKNGRLALVPWEEVVERLKAEIPNRLSRLRDAPEYTDTMGPIAGYWLKYTIKRTERRVQTNAGAGVQTRIELDRFVLIPLNEDIGEPVETALSEGSQLRAALHGLVPGRTTVTVWVYPDSFAQFRNLKHALFEKGYLTAARPLPEGHPIGGSPEGSRSAAQ